MNIQELLTGIPREAEWYLSGWMRFPRMECFCLENARKIRSKIESAKMTEDLRDVLAELEVALRLLANSFFDLEYEPRGGGPDFRVKDGGDAFFVEIKRVREAVATTTYRHCVDRIIAELREIPSPFGVDVCCIEMGEGPAFAQRFEEAVPGVVAECVLALRTCIVELKNDEERKIRPRVFPALEVTFIRVPEKAPDSPTANSLCVSPMLFTQRESFKFTDHL